MPTLSVDSATPRLHHDAVGRHGGLQLPLAHLPEEPQAVQLVRIAGVGVHDASFDPFGLHFASISPRF